MIHTRHAVLRGMMCGAVVALVAAHALRGAYAAPLVAAPQIVLRAGSTVRVQVAPGAKVSIPVVIDMSAAGGQSLGAVTASMTWSPTRLTFDSVKTGPFGTLVANTVNAAAGSVVLSAFSGAGAPTTVTLATLWFTASQTPGGTSLAISPTTAGLFSGADITAQTRPRNVDVCVALNGTWGDVNGDAIVNVIDAQQVARSSVGLAVLDAAVLARQGDVNADNVVNILDAQQIARFSIGLSASARVNTSQFTTPTITAMTLTPPSPGIAIGAGTAVSATPSDAASAALAGCVPVTWASSNTAVATVDSSGFVQGVSNGTAMITASAGGQAAQIPTVIGAASVATSTLGVSASSSASGAPVTLTLTARDANGTAHTNGGLVVAFTKSGGTTDGTLGATTDNGNGTYTATFTGTVAGTAKTIGATIGGVALTSALPTIVVGAGVGSTAQSSVTVSAPIVLSGAPVTLTLTARDASGNPATSGGLVVVFTKGSGTSDGTVSATTDNANGTYTATFTGTAAGTARDIGATIGGASVTTARPAITVDAVSVVSSTVVVSGASVASTSIDTLRLVTKNTAGATLTAGGKTVVFTLGSGTSGGTIGPVTDNTDGTYTALLTTTTTGTARTIAATINGIAVTSTAPTVTVTAAPSLANSMVVTGQAVPVNGTRFIYLQTRDAAGNFLTSGGLDVAFVKGPGTANGTIGPTIYFGSGEYAAQFDATSSGSPRTLGATINGVPITSALPTISISPVSVFASSIVASDSVVAAGSSVTVTFTTRGANGSTVIDGSAHVSIDGCNFGTESSGTLTSAQYDGTSNYTATFNALVAGPPCNFSASVNGYSASALAPVRVAPASLNLTHSTIVSMLTDVAVARTDTIVFTPRDVYDNPAPAGVSVFMFIQAGFGFGTLGPTTAFPDGTFRAEFTGSSVGTPVIAAFVNGQVLPSTTSVNVYQPTMTLGADSITLSVEAGALVAIQQVPVAARVVSSIAGLSASVAISPSGPAACGTVNWLQAPTFSNAGVANPLAAMTIQANGAQLPQGTCRRVITVSSTTAGVEPQTLIVVLNVNRPGGGLTVSHGNAVMFAPLGGAPVTQDIEVRNAVAGELSSLFAFKQTLVCINPPCAQQGPWLNLVFLGGGTATPGTLHMTATPGSLARGTYSVSVTVADAGPPVQQRVVLVRFVVY